MMQRKKLLQYRIASGRFTLPVAILVFILCHLLVVQPMVAADNGLLWNLSVGLFSDSWIGRVVAFVVYGLIGFLLIELNNQFSVIRSRTSLQTTIYLLLVAGCPMLQLLDVGCLLSLCLMGVFFFLFRSYHEIESVYNIFMVHLFIGLGSLIFPQFLFYIPLLWIGQYNFKSLTVKTFFAGVLGGLLPYWLLFAYAFCWDNMSLFYAPFTELFQFQPINFSGIQLWQVAFGGYIVVLTVIAMCYCLVDGFKDKLRTRAYLYFLVLFCLFTLCFVLFQPQHISVLFTILLIGSSLLISRYFVLSDNKSSNVLFILSLIGLFVLIGLNLWML